MTQGSTAETLIASIVSAGGMAALAWGTFALKRWAQRSGERKALRDAELIRQANAEFELDNTRDGETT